MTKASNLSQLLAKFREEAPAERDKGRFFEELIQYYLYYGAIRS